MHQLLMDQPSVTLGFGSVLELSTRKQLQMTLRMKNMHLMMSNILIYQVYQRNPKMNVIVMTNLTMKKNDDYDDDNENTETQKIKYQ